MSLLIVHLIIKPYGFTAHVWEPPACTAPGLQQETWLGVRVVPKHAPGTATTVGVIFREHTLWIFRRGRRGGKPLWHAPPGTCSTGPRSPRGLVGRACKALSRVPVRPRLFTRCMSLGGHAEQHGAPCRQRRLGHDFVRRVRRDCLCPLRLDLWSGGAARLTVTLHLYTFVDEIILF